MLSDGNINLLFHRDIIDHRYFDKRKLYLAFLYKILSKSNGDNLYEDIYLKAFKGDSRKPIIVLTSPFKKGGNSIVINLIPVVITMYLYRIAMYLYRIIDDKHKRI